MSNVNLCEMKEVLGYKIDFWGNVQELLDQKLMTVYTAQDENNYELFYVELRSDIERSGVDVCSFVSKFESLEIANQEGIRLAEYFGIPSDLEKPENIINVKKQKGKEEKTMTNPLMNKLDGSIKNVMKILEEASQIIDESRKVAEEKKQEMGMVYRKAYIVKHPASSLWQFVMTEDERKITELVYKERKEEIDSIAIEDDMTVEEILAEMKWEEVGAETENGVFLREVFIDTRN